MKLFCETSSVLEVGNIKKAAILRDFLNFRSWQHQKTQPFCETSFKIGKLSAELTASCKCVLRFFQSMSLKYCACHEKVRPGQTKCCTCQTKSSSQNWRSDAPKCNPLRKSASGPANISDEHVSCAAPATENASLQTIFKCPMPANAFETITNLSRLLTFDKAHNPLRLPRETTSERPKVVRTCGCFNILTWKCASRHNGVHFFIISTSKSASRMVCFAHSDFEMRFAPQRRAIFHLSSGTL